MSLPYADIFIGVDGGGTKCKAVVAKLNGTELKILGEAVSGPANVFSDTELAQSSLVSASEMALVNAGLPSLSLNQLAVVAGLAGANVTSALTTMQRWQHPFKAFHVTHDLHIACLAAHQGKDGAVIVSGTGSCGYSIFQHKQITLGGHGFPHGDIASGAWFGLKAVEAVLMSLDGLRQTTQMTESLLTLLACQTSLDLVEKVAGQGATFYARLACVVFTAAKQGDLVAITIIEQGIAYLSELAVALTTAHSTEVALLGGLAETLYAYFPKAIQQQLFISKAAPEQGALLLAKQLYV